FRQIDVLDCVEDLYAFGHRLLERFASGDQSGSASTLVDYCSLQRWLDVIFAGRPARVDQTGATHVAIQHLVARKIDRVIAAQLRVDLLVGLAEFESIISAVVLGEFLLDYVGLNSDAEVICLPGQIGGVVIVGFLGLKARVAKIAPQDSKHTPPGDARKGLG